MTMRPTKPCAKCKRVLTQETYCSVCAIAKKKQYQSQRNNSWQYLYNSGRWRKQRRFFLINHPLCVYHLTQGVSVEATVVDHIIPHKGDERLFWDHNNWQALCKWCHDVKTSNEGSFANKIKNKHGGGGEIKSLQV